MTADVWMAYFPLAATAPALYAVAAIDARTFRIPDRWSYPMFLATLGGMLLLGSTIGSFADLIGAVAGSILFTGTLGGLHLVRPDGLGLGDVKLAATLGLLAGWGRSSVIDAALVVVWALMLASTLGLTVLAVRRARGLAVDRSTALPFGPPLCAGTVVAVAAFGLIG